MTRNQPRANFLPDWATLTPDQVPPISVIVRVWTRTDECHLLVEALAKQVPLPAEVVLIDSGSAENVITDLRRWAKEGYPTPSGQTMKVRLMEIPNSDYQSARALNQAIAIAENEYIAVISQDAIPEKPDYLLKLAEPLADPTIAGSYGRQLFTPGPPDPLGEKDLLRVYPADSRVQVYPECWFVNTCSLLRRSLWERHMFSEKAHISEDHEWGLWAQRQGYKLAYIGAAAVWHHHRYKSARDVWKRHFHEGLGLAWTHQRRVSLARSVYRATREIASDAQWLLKSKQLSYLPEGAFHRLTKAVALWWGHFRAELPSADGNDMPADVVLQLDNVWRMYPLWKRRPSTLKEKLLHTIQQFRTKEKPYTEFWAVRGVSLTVKRGEVVGICGSNGSGKSTLLRTIARIMPATHGRLAIRGRIAPLLELGTGVHPELTGYENAKLNAAMLGLTPSEIEQKIASIVEFAELGEFINVPVKTYSAGMLMRLGFSVMTHVHADILLIDEVLSVGDARYQQKCSSWMRRLREQGVTTIIVSHDLPAMSEVCDRVVWLDRGVVAADGPPDEVLSKYYPEYAPARTGPENE